MAEREAARAGRHGFVDALVADRGADRGIARAEALGGGDHVGREREPVGREPAACAAHAGHDLVQADEEAVALAALGEPLPEALGRRVGGQGGRAHGLGEEGRDGIGPNLVENAVERLQAPARRSGRTATCSVECGAAP